MNLRGAVSEFLRVLAIAALAYIVIVVILAGFDGQAPQSFTVHAAEASR